MTKIILASSNAGKLKELRHGLKNTRFMVDSYGVSAVEENATTFIENALLKAKYAAAKTGLPTIADDSGLVVPTLFGQPGIYSARFAGEPQNAENNIAKLLNLLKNETDRRAWFHCSLVFLKSPTDPAPIICEGRWHGKILTRVQGTNGFGYDPIFMDTESGKSAAELDRDHKNRISHRGQALTDLLQLIQNIYHC